MSTPEDARVAFGDHESDTMPVPWAEKMLIHLKKINPGLFGALLAEAVTGVAPRKARTIQEGTKE